MQNTLALAIYHNELAQRKGNTISSMHIYLASDHAGYDLKEQLKLHITENYSELDMRKLADSATSSQLPVDYPDVANNMAYLWQKSLEHDPAEAKNIYGILICGSGAGMAIAANRHRHLRAVVCLCANQAVLAREHNDANVLVLASRLTSSAKAKEILQAFVTSPFLGGRHRSRIDKLGLV